jgi:hypothetical protein
MATRRTTAAGTSHAKKYVERRMSKPARRSAAVAALRE